MKKNRSPKTSSLLSHTSYLKSKTTGRFTLIELLIVVAMIAILAGILMPALSSALQKAKNIACTGNQKMIGLSLSMYATDNREYFPPLQHMEYGFAVASLAQNPADGRIYGESIQ